MDDEVDPSQENELGTVRVQQVKEKYLERVARYVPTSVIAALVAMDVVVGIGLDADDPDPVGLWIYTAFAFVVALFCPLLVKRTQGANYRTLDGVGSVVSAFVWLYATGGPFTYWGRRDELIAALLLIFWGFVVGVVLFRPIDDSEEPEGEPERSSAVAARDSKAMKDEGAYMDSIDVGTRVLIERVDALEPDEGVHGALPRAYEEYQGKITEVIERHPKVAKYRLKIDAGKLWFAERRLKAVG